MAKYIPLDAVLAEIERRKEKCELFYNIAFSNNAEFAKLAIEEQKKQYDSFKGFINTLKVKGVDLEHLEQEVKDFCYEYDDRKEKWYELCPNDKKLLYNPTWANFAMSIAKHFFELGVSCPINHINIEEVKAAAKAWSEDDENTRGCDYIGAVVAERAFVACAEWLINKAQKGESYE